MSWLRRHPRDRDLNRFADGELGEPVHGRVAAHLADCTRCRDEVALIRRMSDVARTLPTPIATDEVLRRALARRTGGERVLLPLSDAGAPRPSAPRRFAPAAIAALLTLMIASLVVSVRVLEADRPLLQVLPERPEAGEKLTVLYDGGALFDDETHLALRARYRTGNERHWQLLAGVLVRGEDGRFRAEVPLPDSVVYAAFTVEDMEGHRLDSNNRELWDVMVHGDDDRPTLAAMTARLRDLERRDWGEAYEVALAMTEAYPEAPQSWAIRFSFEFMLFDQDSIMAFHSKEFTRLEQLVSASPRPDPEQVAWLATYAVGLEKLDVAGNWVRLAVAEAPHLAATADAQAMLLSYYHPENILPALEATWIAAGDVSKPLAAIGWQASTRAGDPAQKLAWLKRFLAVHPSQEYVALPPAYEKLYDDPKARTWIEELARSRLNGLNAPKPLTLTTTEHERRRAKDDQKLLARLAVKAYQLGDPSVAEEFASKALNMAWESDALLEIEATLRALGHMAAANEALSRAAVDPVSRVVAQARAREHALLGTDRWDTLRGSANREFSNYVMGDAVVRYPGDGIDLDGPDGAIDLHDLLAGKVAVVVFFSRYCAPGFAELPVLESIEQTLAERGARLVLIDTDSRGTLGGYLRREGIDLAVHVDRNGQARRAFKSSNAPDYFVVDAAGRIRFEHSQLAEILRQYETLASDMPVLAKVE